MKVRERTLVALALLAVSLTRPAFAGGWSVQKNEQDPFDKSKSTFIATEGGDTGVLAIRCLEGSVSLLVGSGPSNASAGSMVAMKIVADEKDVQPAVGAVIVATSSATAVQFGSVSTLEYLDGTQKIAVRYELGDAIITSMFSGGTSLNSVIVKARKACGIHSPEIQTGRNGQRDCSSVPAAQRTLDCALAPKTTDMPDNKAVSSHYSCDKFDDQKSRIKEATNRSLAEQKVTAQFSEIELLGPASSVNDYYCLIY